MDTFSNSAHWDFRSGDLVRRLRRVLDASQRELADLAGVSRSTIDRIESGRVEPRVHQLQELLGLVGWGLTVADIEGRLVDPLRELGGDLRDGAERRYPAHLDVILDPEMGDWWGDYLGLRSPPETFNRNRAVRDLRRSCSQADLAPYRRGVYRPYG
jgi:transcriptional regulator with XRE-family HTH domain